MENGNNCANFKPGKDLTDSQNYRPIALTSCVCKIIEKMVNTILIQYLENNKVLAHTQCGFRKTRSTLDHLVRLDTYIRKGFTQNQDVVAGFFDLEKAYDLTWRYGVMRDLYESGLRGRLSMFVENFLSNRVFCVRVSTEISEVKRQRNGIPQGSTLCVTLFAMKINSLARLISNEIFSSLFVDDFLISYSQNSVHNIERILQDNINSIYGRAEQNGFRFLTKKTKMMHF